MEFFFFSLIYERNAIFLSFISFHDFETFLYRYYYFLLFTENKKRTEILLLSVQLRMTLPCLDQHGADTRRSL